MEKEDKFELLIEDMDVDGNGIGHIDGMTIFVHGGLPGEKIRAKVIKVKKTFAVAIIDEFIEKSPSRRDFICPVYKQCGGCTLQHAAYGLQLNIKHNRVKSCMSRIAKTGTEVLFPLSAGNEFRYRNKAAFPVNADNGQIKIGFYKKRSHDICNVEDCLLQSEEVSALICIVKAWIEEEHLSIYNEIRHKGLLRHIIVRSNSKGEMMMTLVINGNDIPGHKNLIRRMRSVPELKTIVLSHNREKGNVILGSEEAVVFGPGYLTEEIGGLLFNVSAHSFMQVNYHGMNLLYNTLFEILKLEGNETVVDLYCGVGTISLLAAQKSGKVYGVEIVEDAIESAKQNAELNNIRNAEFRCGDADVEFPEIIRKAGKIDVIIVDPPRKGLSEKVIDEIVNACPEKIGYVSCDPATLARDIAIFAGKGYMALYIQPVDMFPQTTHVETVVLMSRA